jgi:DUF4097 and DUF4098 domain-containing protein YvlB
MCRLTATAVVVVLLAAPACVRHTVPNTVHESRTFPVTAGKLVRLDVRSLDVDVKVVEASTISVTVDLQVRSSSRAWTKRWLERNTPVFEDSDSVLEVRLPERERRSLVLIGFVHTRGRLDVVVPASCRLEVKTASGDVKIAGEATLSGLVRVTTSSGDVKVGGGVHELIVRTASGDVRIAGTALDQFEADTASGDVTLAAGSAKAIVDTASGDIRLEKLTGDLSADTSSGDVWATWEQLPAGCMIRVRASSGDVRLRVPDSTALKGEIATSSGRIHSQFPAKAEKRGHTLSFEATGEAVNLQVHTSSGDVSLRSHS